MQIYDHSMVDFKFVNHKSHNVSYSVFVCLLWCYDISTASEIACYRHLRSRVIQIHATLDR